MGDYETSPADSAYHRTLPIGERLSARPLVDDDLSCFDDVTLSALAPMLVPERPRAGWDRIGIPYVGGIAPREHHRLEDAPVELLTTLGPPSHWRLAAARRSPAARQRRGPAGRTEPRAHCDGVPGAESRATVARAIGRCGRSGW